MNFSILVLCCTLLILTVPRSSEAACTFPADVQGLWLTHHSDPTTPWVIKYGSDTTDRMPASMAGRTILPITCTDGLTASGSPVFTYFNALDAGVMTVYACAQIYLQPTAMLFRDVGIPGTEGPLEASECASRISEDETSSWYIRYPPATEGIAIPLPEGEYQLTYSETAGVVECEGDATSTASVAGNTITFNSCYQGDTSYNRPLLATTLTSYSSVGGNFLNGAANGDVLLLADLSDLSSPKFYCARYMFTASSIDISLDVSNEFGARCTQQDFRSAEYAVHTAFSMVYTSEVTSTTTTTTTTQPGSGPASCTFPDAVQGNWLTHFSDPDTPWIIKYGSDTSDRMPASMADKSVMPFTCTDGYVEPGGTVFTYFSSLHSIFGLDLFACVQVTYLDNALLYKDVAVQNGPLRARDCLDMIPADETASWYFQDPPVTEGFPIPLPEGEYQLTYSETAGVVECVGDATSIATVAGNTVTINSCFQGVTSYSQPYRDTTLTYYGGVGGDFLNGADNGDVLLLADFSDPLSPKYYCVRYAVTASSIELSLELSDELKTRCSQPGFDSAVFGSFTAFVLSRDVPTTAPPLVPTTVQPVVPTTAQPEKPTTAPEELTTVPAVKPTTVPEKLTTAPAKPTTAPEKPTTAPAKPTTAPAERTTAPAEPTTAPENPTTALPPKPTSAAPSPTTAPAGPTTAGLPEECPEPCMNGGLCEEQVCQCPDGVSGPTCETDSVDECESAPCYNGATCTDQIMDYICNCTENWNGTNCEEEKEGFAKEYITIILVCVVTMLIILVVIVCVGICRRENTAEPAYEKQENSANHYSSIQSLTYSPTSWYPIYGPQYPVDQQYRSHKAVSFIDARGGPVTSVGVSHSFNW